MSYLLPFVTTAIKAINSNTIKNEYIDLIPDVFEPLKALHENIQKARLHKLLSEVIKDGGTTHLLKDVSKLSEDRTTLFEDLIQACINDSDSEKTSHYSQLAVAILSGLIEEKILRKHFLISLEQLSLAELEILRRAYVVLNYSIITEISDTPLSVSESLKIAQKQILGDVHIRNLQQLGLINDEQLTATGLQFTTSIYKGDDLTPLALSWSEWQNGILAIATKKGKNKNKEEIIKQFKKLRIQCEEINVNDITHDKARTANHKAIIFLDNHSNLIYSEQQRLIKFSDENHRRIVVLPQARPMPNEFSSAPVNLSENGSIELQCQEIAKHLKYILPDFS